MYPPNVLLEGTLVQFASWEVMKTGQVDILNTQKKSSVRCTSVLYFDKYRWFSHYLLGMNNLVLWVINISIHKIQCYTLYSINWIRWCNRRLTAIAINCTRHSSPWTKTVQDSRFAQARAYVLGWLCFLPNLSVCLSDSLIKEWRILRPGWHLEQTGMTPAHPNRICSWQEDGKSTASRNNSCCSWLFVRIRTTSFCPNGSFWFDMIWFDVN